MTPRATYRLQLHAGFGFEAAAQLCDYLAELGVSHLYASPYLQAAAGSQHGYDVVDHARLNAELGGAAGYARLVQALREHGLEQVLDIVPNHMAIGTHENRWWWDVLENGPSSHYAAHFDVDWSGHVEDRVLLPVLGERYGEALRSRALRIERHGGSCVVRYHEHRWPASPMSLCAPLHRAAQAQHSPELAFLADALARLPAPQRNDHAQSARRDRDKRILLQLLAQLLTREPALAHAFDAQLEALAHDPLALDAWLEQQSYRLVYWKTAESELDYRRFFDVTSLAGLRTEDPRVFEDTHGLVLRMLHADELAGLRVDHPDGLRDPQAYCVRLRAAAPGAYLVVEKILGFDEALPQDWPVDGTTGYELMCLVDQLYVDQRNAQAFSTLCTERVGEAQLWEPMARAARLQILDEVLGSERQRLLELACQWFGTRMELRDYTRAELWPALTELLASYPVYRTYVRFEDSTHPPGARTAHASAQDIAVVTGAIAQAARARPEVDVRIWSALQEALLGQDGSPLAAELAMRTQQVTSALAAKAIEDTLFYRYARLIALNEVGGAPERFGISVEDFHRRLAARSLTSMLASQTHDTKRGEDVRTRLTVLSELPDEFARAVRAWSPRAQRHRSAHGPDALCEYFFFQTLIGAFPLPVERACDYMRKAVREAKLHTRWTAHDEAYEAAVEAFVCGVLSDAELMAEIEAFVTPLAELGFVASLGKTLLKLTLPGVPDVYQGCELWDLSLVDPDNRRPVDFAARRALLARAAQLTAQQAYAELHAGTPKLWLIHRVLTLRRAQPALFEVDYRPLRTRGEAADSVLAYARGEQLLVIVPRLVARFRTGPAAFADTRVHLPQGSFDNVLTQETGISAQPRVADLWSCFPVALLRRSR